MDSRSAEHQAGSEYARQSSEPARPAGVACLSAEPHLNAPLPAIVTDAVLDDDAEHRALLAAWREPRGLIGWLKRVDHRSIGKRYIVTAFVFFMLAGVLALLMRLQLARSDNGLMGPDLYNQLFTVHGTAMMF